LRGQECYRPGDFFRLSKPLHWNWRNELLRKFIDGFFWKPGPLNDRRDDRPWRDRVDADAAPRQFRGCGSRQRTQRRFACRIRAGPCGTCLARNAGIQNDRRAVIQQWQGFLDGEVRSHHVDVETLVVLAFRGLGKWGKLRHSRVYEQDIDFAQFLLDFRVQLVYVREFGHVPLHRHDAVADGFDRFVQGFSASAQDGYPRAFFLQALAVANPMPLFPPVTTATVPSSLFMSVAP
jgi:hypothetical protein